MRSIKLAVPTLMLASLTLISGCSDLSGEELASIKSECASFHKQERAKSGSIVKAIDHWTKDGRVVVELSEKESESASKYTAANGRPNKNRTCVAPTVPSVAVNPFCMALRRV